MEFFVFLTCCIWISLEPGHHEVLDRTKTRLAHARVISLLQFPDQPMQGLIEAWTDAAVAAYVLERRSAVAMAKAILGPEDPAAARVAAPYRYTKTSAQISACWCTWLTSA